MGDHECRKRACSAGGVHQLLALNRWAWPARPVPPARWLGPRTWPPPRVLLVVGAAVLLTAFITACSTGDQQAAPAPASSTGGPATRLPRPAPGKVTPLRLSAPRSHLLVTAMAFDQAPQLGGQATLTVTITTVITAPDTTLEFRLPSGVTFVQGDLTWQGDLAVNESRDFQFILAFPTAGEFKITVVTMSVLGPTFVIGDSRSLYVHVSESGSIVGNTPAFPTPRGPWMAQPEATMTASPGP